MNKKSKLVFIITFILAYFVVGYLRQTWHVNTAVRVGNVTLWDNFYYYFIRGFWGNLISAFVIALIPAWAVRSLKI